MQLHIENSQQMKFCTAFHQQFKCFNHECQMPAAHSVFKQVFKHSVHNVIVHQLQQHMIEICCKMIHLP